ncbi:MAG: YqaE/Pmp3 family membrane protein [Bacteroidia bacterium]|nr:YqaE/Pmp3 family membrane protein [Bacteroidia bacterium]
MALVGGGAVSPIILAILCIFIPPLAVFLKEGLTVNFWIDLILCFLFFIPGIIFAFLVCFDII